MQVIYCHMTTFSDWLTNKMREREMSPAQLSRLIKKDQSVVSRILNSERRPANETLEVIARALKIPQETVFRAAGILPPQQEADEWVKEQSHKLSQLKSERRHFIEKLLDTLLKEDEPAVVLKKVKAKG